MANVRNKERIVDNDIDHYKDLVGKRGKKSVRHYTTPILQHPTISERAGTPTTAHLWTAGDRFYKLAHQYYGDVDFWWVIAWWNGYPTEGHIKSGNYIEIPLDLPAALEALGI